MINLGKKTLTDRDGNQYTLIIAYNEDAIMENMISTNITAVKTDAITGKKTQVEADVELLPHLNLVRIKFPAADPIKIQIGETALLYDDDIRDFNDPTESDGFLQRIIGDNSSIEEILSHIPAGDPLLGCLLKAGIVTTLGQVIKCHHKTQLNGADERLRKKIWNIIRCLGANSQTMLAKASLRTVKCWLALGFA